MSGHGVVADQEAGVGWQAEFLRSRELGASHDLRGGLAGFVKRFDGVGALGGQWRAAIIRCTTATATAVR